MARRSELLNLRERVIRPRPSARTGRERQRIVVGMIGYVAWFAAAVARPGSRGTLVVVAAGTILSIGFFPVMAAAFRRNAAIIADGERLGFRDRWGRSSWASITPECRILDVVVRLQRGLEIRRWIVLAPDGRAGLTMRVDQFVKDLDQIETALAAPVQKAATPMTPRELVAFCGVRLPAAERNIYAVVGVAVAIILVLLLFGIGVVVSPR